MTALLTAPLPSKALGPFPRMRPAGCLGVAVLLGLALGGCASQPARYASGGSGGRGYDSRLGVYASPRLIEDGEPVPRGGGSYLVGRPYTIGGRMYFPSQRPEGYTVVGTASWYGDAFHGRRTANGEIFDKNSISAAHPTLPLPSYVRVTNTGNGRSMIVRVNDRGPYHGGRVMDVSQRVAEALAFKGQGMARVRIDYIGRASLAGSDDAKLLATLSVDGMPAQLDGSPAAPTMVADEQTPVAPLAPSVPSAPPPPVAHLERIARATEADLESAGAGEAVLPPRRPVPAPPPRPFDFAPVERGGPAIPGQRAELDRLIRAKVATVAPRPVPLVSFAVPGPSAPEETRPRQVHKRVPFYHAADALTSPTAE